MEITTQNQREIDLKFIGENLYVLRSRTQEFFSEQGRGALIIDHSLSGKPDPAAHYVPAPNLPEGNKDTRRMVQNYLPGAQFIIVLIKPGQLETSYQIDASSGSAV